MELPNDDAEPVDGGEPDEPADYDPIDWIGFYIG